MIETKTKYTYNDVCIVPAEVSSIRHRSQCNVFYEDEMLPLFTAPMNTVVDETNFRLFKRNNIHPILPRTSNIKLRLKLSNEFWCAFSLSEFEQYFVKCEDEENMLDYGEKHYVLIDIANGHMKDLLLLIKAAKEKLVNNITIMAGNIANPETYNDLSEAGTDYVRIGIGGGHGCLTTSNTGIHYPMISLIDACRTAKNRYNCKAKIVADGGIRGYSDIIKALAAGADYVMCGSIFNKMLESSGETRILEITEKYQPFIHVTNNDIVNQYEDETRKNFDSGICKYKKQFYGMSTKIAQKIMGCNSLKTSEGLERIQPVEYTMDGWIENFIDYLRSAMSYTGHTSLRGFTSGRVLLTVMSNNTYHSVNK